MKRLTLSALLATVVALSTAVVAGAVSESTAGTSNKTFVAMRDEGQSYSARDLVTDHFYTKTRRGKKNALGAYCSATLFYSTTTKDNKLGQLFGNEGSSIVVKGDGATSFDDNNRVVGYINGDSNLYGAMIDHSPYMSHSTGKTTTMTPQAGNTNYYDIVTTTSANPMHGTIALAPERTVIGTKLNWFQSLDTLVPGMSFGVTVPVAQVTTSMRAKATSDVASSFPQTWYVTTNASPALDSNLHTNPIRPNGDGGTTLVQYFTGNVTKDAATTYTVGQAALENGLLTFGTDEMTTVSIGDIQVRVAQDFKFAVKGQPVLRVGVGLTVPAGNTTTGVKAFESYFGGNGHYYASVFGSLEGSFAKVKDVSIGGLLSAEWKYGVTHDETRLLGLETAAGAVLSGSQYRLMMKNESAGVFPAANILKKTVSVRPGQQLDIYAGLTAQWKSFSFDLGYNLFAQGTEKVTLDAKNWSNDTYALAHPYFTSNNIAVSRNIESDVDFPGNTYSKFNGSNMTASGTGDSNNPRVAFLEGNNVWRRGVTQVENSLNDSVTVDRDYDDAKSPIEKHANKIGANRDRVLYADNIQDGSVANSAITKSGSFTSDGGPVQAPGIEASALVELTAATDGTASAQTTTQKVTHRVSTAAARTESSMTHALVAGASYKLGGNYPVVFSIGGTAELAGTTTKPSIAKWSLWGKAGIGF